MDTEEAWAALQATRGDLDAFMRDADGLAVSQIVHPHPAPGPRDFYGWIGFVGAHEARHAAQLREIAASLPRA